MEPTDIFRAIAIANGHTDPDEYVARCMRALNGQPVDVQDDHPAPESEGGEA